MSLVATRPLKPSREVSLSSFVLVSSPHSYGAFYYSTARVGVGQLEFFAGSEGGGVE